tara:strand:+ start:905 stop:1015 length:111 start_codon:yes stop_codon:yes gene_type:complete
MEKECIDLLDTLWHDALYLGGGIIIGMFIIKGKPKI